MVSVVRGCHDCHITVLSSTDGTVQCGDGQSGHLLSTCHVQGRTDGQGHIDGVSSRSRSDTCAGNAGQNLNQVSGYPTGPGRSDFRSDVISERGRTNGHVTRSIQVVPQV